MKKYMLSTFVEVVEKTRTGSYLVQYEGKPECRWLISEKAFDHNYIEAPLSMESFEEMREKEVRFGFDIAIDALKEGFRVAREGWNGMFIYLVAGSEVPASKLREAAAKHVGEELQMTDTVTINHHIDMKIDDRSICVGWTPSQADMLAGDWMIV